jgi:hypothetical protein
VTDVLCIALESVLLLTAHVVSRIKNLNSRETPFLRKGARRTNDYEIGVCADGKRDRDQDNSIEVTRIDAAF